MAPMALRPLHVGIVLAVLSSSAVPALAQPTQGPAPRPRARIDVGPAIADLQSNEMARMERALPLLGSSGNPGAAAPIVAFLRRGPPGPLLVPAIEALGALARPEAQDVLIEMLRHYNPVARAKAATALGAVRSPRASRALVAALSDREETVRAAAAQSLATAGMHDAVEPLLVAFTRGNDAAATPIGAFGDTEDMAKLVARVGQVPLSVLLPAFRLYLARRDVAEAAKLTLVDQLAELGTPEVKRFLLAVGGELPPGQQRLRDHVNEVAGRIAG